MIKRIFLSFFCLMLLAFSACSVFAATYTYDIADADTESPRVYDEDNLLTIEEEKLLTQRLNAISEQYECDVVVNTVPTVGIMDVEEYADFLYAAFDYGLGDAKNCFMLFICKESRDNLLTPYGDAEKYFGTSTRERIADNFVPYLTDGDYYAAFNSFADDCEEALANYSEVKVKPLWIGASVVIGIVIAFIAVLVMKSQLKSVRFQPAANSYVKNDSLNVTQRRDIFLYSTVSRTPKPKNNSSSGGSAGSAGSRTGGKF